jgi:hypothetical protein
MGFIVSESGFEMTPGSRETDTPGIWRQDGPNPGDLFTSSFATAFENAPELTDAERDAQRNARLQQRADRIGNRVQNTYSNAPTLKNATKSIKLINKQKKILGKKTP